MKRLRHSTPLVLFLFTALLWSLGCRDSAGQHGASGATGEVPTLQEIQAHLSQRRAQNLERLRAYRLAGEYPRNRVVDGLANVFVDEDGKHCAVAHLMHLDGETALIDQTAANDNLIVLASVSEGPLYDWILGSGFTQAEIARIQEPYMPVRWQDPNFDVVEDQRLNDHFVQVEQELRAAEAQQLLAAARTQRAELQRQYGMATQ